MSELENEQVESVKTEEESCEAHSEALEKAYMTYRLSHKQEEVLEAVEQETESDQNIAKSLEALQELELPIIATVHEGSDTLDIKQPAFPETKELIENVKDASLVEVDCGVTARLFGADPHTGETISVEYKSGSIEVQELPESTDGVVKAAKDLMVEKGIETSIDLPMKERLAAAAVSMGLTSPLPDRDPYIHNTASNEVYQEVDRLLDSNAFEFGLDSTGTITAPTSTLGEVDALIQAGFAEIDETGPISSESWEKLIEQIANLSDSDLQQLGYLLDSMVMDHADTPLSPRLRFLEDLQTMHRVAADILR